MLLKWSWNRVWNILKTVFRCFAGCFAWWSWWPTHHCQRLRRRSSNLRFGTQDLEYWSKRPNSRHFLVVLLSCSSSCWFQFLPYETCPHGVWPFLFHPFPSLWCWRVGLNWMKWNRRIFWIALRISKNGVDTRSHPKDLLGMVAVCLIEIGLLLFIGLWLPYSRAWSFSS